MIVGRRRQILKKRTVFINRITGPAVGYLVIHQVGQLDSSKRFPKSVLPAIVLHFPNGVCTLTVELVLQYLRTCFSEQYSFN